MRTGALNAGFNATFIAVLAVVLVNAATSAQAASFDCNKARSKLNRMICADADLSALDSRVWNTFGGHLKSLSPAQLAHVRERHFLWRRQRGWYDDNVASISADYQRHLAWLTHPLLPLEGRYETDAGHAVQVEVEVDAAALNTLSVQGEAAGPRRFTWVAPAGGEVENRIVRDAEAADVRPGVPLINGMVEIVPVFLGAPPAPVQHCRIDIRFGDDALTLATQGACGAELAGNYRKAKPAEPFWAVRPRKGGAIVAPAPAPLN